MAPQRGMLMVKKYRSKFKDGVEGYIEEGVVRCELSDNFCFYNPKYDTIEGQSFQVSDFDLIIEG